MSRRLTCSIAKTATSRRVAIIGFGTRGQRAARRLLSRGHEVHVFDEAFEYFDSSPARALKRLAVYQHASVSGVVADCDLIIVAVPASAAIDVALKAANNVEPRAIYLDATGCGAPAARRVARILEATGADYARASDPEIVVRGQGLIALSDLLALYRAPVLVGDGWEGRLQVGDSDTYLSASAANVVPIRKNALIQFAAGRGVAA